MIIDVCFNINGHNVLYNFPLKVLTPYAYFQDMQSMYHLLGESEIKCSLVSALLSLTNLQAPTLMALHK
jgi:hypothetical protein